MRILVTGGAGFVGSHLVDAYLQQGHTVVVVDDLSAGKKSNVHPKAHFVQMDIRDPHLSQVFQEYGIDFVNHQAARVDLRASLEKPVEYAEVNLLGGIHLLECARRHKVRGTIYASSGGCAYGEPLSVPTDEEEPVRPRDPYGASKVCLEVYWKTYGELYQLPYTIFRYSNVYGPRQNASGEAGVVAVFSRQMIEGKEVTINGTGEQLRDYVFVADVVRANLLATDRSYNAIFNVGTGVGTTVLEIYQQLKNLIECPKKPVYVPPKPGEVQKSILSSKKIARECGWKAEVAFADGLRKTVEYLKNNH